MNDLSAVLTISNIRTVLTTILDVFVMWLILYYVLRLVRSNSRTIQIFKGILFVVIVDVLSKVLGLRTLEYFADMFINWGFLALIIIFQPEFRSLLESLGKTNVFSRISGLSVNEKETLVDQIVTAVMLLSKDKTGALISIERNQSLEDFIVTGTRIDSTVTAEILTSIFVTTTPLHDGAVIIQGDRIACASAYFPPTQQNLPGKFGARHRAAVGISEVSDALTIVVSEETGNVSITEHGLMSHVGEKQLRDFLCDVICGVTTGDKEDLFEDRDDYEEDDLTRINNEMERIKLPQNHKHDRPVPSYPDRETHMVQYMEKQKVEKKKVAPVEVIPSHSQEGGDADENQ